MIQKLQNFAIYLAIIPASLIIVSFYAILGILGLTMVAGIVIGIAEWISS